MAIQGNKRQYLAIHEFKNSRFFRGIYVGMAIYVLEYMTIHANARQYIPIHGKYMTS
jgi:hypothetical protein